MNRNLNIARNLGYATVPDDLLVKPRRLDEFMPHETLIICTGSQGEPRSALTRIAFGDHPAVQIHYERHRRHVGPAGPRQRGQGARDREPPLPARARRC